MSGLNRKIGYEKPWNRKELGKALVLRAAVTFTPESHHDGSKAECPGHLSPGCTGLHFLPTKKDPLQEGTPKETFLLLIKQPLFTLMLQG